MRFAGVVTRLSSNPDRPTSLVMKDMATGVGEGHRPLGHHPLGDLERPNETPTSSLIVAQALRRRMGAYRPIFEGMRRRSLELVLVTAAHYGFRELATPDEPWRDRQSCWQRWQRRRKAPSYRL
jgi:hypothetical protein